MTFFRSLRIIPDTVQHVCTYLVLQSVYAEASSGH